MALQDLFRNWFRASLHFSNTPSHQDAATQHVIQDEEQAKVAGIGVEADQDEEGPVDDNAGLKDDEKPDYQDMKPEYAESGPSSLFIITTRPPFTFRLKSQLRLFHGFER